MLVRLVCNFLGGIVSKSVKLIGFPGEKLLLDLYGRSLRGLYVEHFLRHSVPVSVVLNIWTNVSTDVVRYGRHPVEKRWGVAGQGVGVYGLRPDLIEVGLLFHLILAVIAPTYRCKQSAGELGPLSGAQGGGGAGRVVPPLDGGDNGDQCGIKIFRGRFHAHGLTVESDGLLQVKKERRSDAAKGILEAFPMV